MFLLLHLWSPSVLYTPLPPTAIDVESGGCMTESGGCMHAYVWEGDASAEKEGRWRVLTRTNGPLKQFTFLTKPEGTSAADNDVMGPNQVLTSTYCKCIDSYDRQFQRRPHHLGGQTIPQLIGCVTSVQMQWNSLSSRESVKPNQKTGKKYKLTSRLRVNSWLTIWLLSWCICVLIDTCRLQLNCVTLTTTWGSDYLLV